jgi:hypothetical protein
MLEISERTFARLQEPIEQAFLTKLAAFLREKVPSLAKEAPEATVAQCRLLKAQANSYDMHSEQAVAAFAMTAAILGVDFVERFRGARQILWSNEPETRKAKLLEGFTVTLLAKLKKR